MNVDYEKLSEYIKRARFDRKKSQEDVAKFIGISTTTYRSYENNPRQISLDVGIKINEFLNCNIFEFFLNVLLQNATDNSETINQNPQEKRE